MRFPVSIVFFLLFLAYLAFESRALLIGPELSLLADNPTITSERAFTIKGNVGLFSQVFINNREAAVDGQGNFSLPFLLGRGVNTITITAKNRFGRETVKYLTIIVK